MILCVTLNKLLNLLHLLVSSLCNTDNGFPSHRVVSVKPNDSIIPRQSDAMDTIHYCQFCYGKEAWKCWMTLPGTLPWVCNVCHNFYQHALYSLLFLLLQTSLQTPEKVLREGQDAGWNSSDLYWWRWNKDQVQDYFHLEIFWKGTCIPKKDKTLNNGSQC